MNALHLLAGIAVILIGAYFTYGTYLAKSIFKLESTAVVPASELEDGQDYIPTAKGVIFGHHFTSIAGTGPIVGPAIGVIWGWVPAVLWIVGGAILMGGVHDLASIVISLRNKGKTITEVASLYISQKARKMFFAIVFIALLIVIAIFGLVIAVIFARFPQSVIPVWSEIPIALALGLALTRKTKGIKWILLASKLAFLATFVLGYLIPISVPEIAGIPATGVWTIILLGYAFIASVAPVTALLQPRDYLNAWQLYAVMAFVLAGIVVCGGTTSFQMTAPMFNLNVADAPSMWPFLFITIACGAVSGFHSLVGSGTTSKQLQNETHAKSVGYGSMLLEAFLACIIVVAVTAGISMAYTLPTGETLTGITAWQAHYGSWGSGAGLTATLNAVVIGMSNILGKIGIPSSFGIIVIGVFIASFAGTTLDSATRIQRYVITELVQDTRFSQFSNKWLATTLAVLTAGLLAFSSGADGKGALILWPMFGAVNQLLASLALIVATIYLKQKHRWGWLVTGIPCIAMSIITIWTSIENQIEFMRSGLGVISIMGAIILILTIGIYIEAIKIFRQKIEFIEV
jgi:carbon starvation protein